MTTSQAQAKVMLVKRNTVDQNKSDLVSQISSLNKLSDSQKAIDFRCVIICDAAEAILLDQKSELLASAGFDEDKFAALVKFVKKYITMAINADDDDTILELMYSIGTKLFFASNQFGFDLMHRSIVSLIK